MIWEERNDWVGSSALFFIMGTKKDEISFEAHYNPNRKCISIDGTGEAEIKFTTDATQLAPVLTSLATFKENRVKVTLELIRQESDKNGEKKRKTKAYKG